MSSRYSRAANTRSKCRQAMPAQQRAERGRRELRVVFLRQSVEGAMRNWARSSAASLTPVTVRLAQP